MNIQLAYEEHGSGPAILLIHGHPFDRSMWTPQVHDLQTDYHVITPDLRGYGASPVIDGKTFFPDFATDIAAFADSLGIDAFVVCGLSMGGQITLDFYRQFPERVLALILADTFAQPDPPAIKEARYRTADRIAQEGMEAYSREVLPKMIAPETIASHPEVATHVLRMMREASPLGAAAALRGRAERPDYTDLLPSIAVPTLVIVGELDEFTPVADARFMAERIPQAQLAIIDGAGHMPNLERPERFNAIVRSFLQTAASAVTARKASSS